MTTQDINNKTMKKHLDEVNKSSNNFIKTTLFVMMAIIIIGFVFG